MHKKEVFVALVSMLMLSVLLCGCTQTENSTNNGTEEESIDVKFVDFDSRTEDGSDSAHYNEIWDIVVYNEGGKGYATIHASVTQQTGDEAGKVWGQEQIVHLDAKESKELTFVFEDLILGESYQPSQWVEYD